MPPEWEYDQTLDYSTMEVHWYRRRATETPEEETAEESTLTEESSASAEVTDSER
jgi:hypothetical protein